MTTSTSSTMSNRNNSPRPANATSASPARRSHLPPRATMGPGTATAARHANVGSATQTITPPDSASSRSVSPEPLVLRLRGAHDTSARPSTRRRITWAEDVVDNEGLGRKSSKVCCIYHRPREFGESSSEDDSSDSDSSSDGSDSDDGGARMSGNRRGRKHDKDKGHKHGDGDAQRVLLIKIFHRKGNDVDWRADTPAALSSQGKSAFASL